MHEAIIEALIVHTPMTLDPSQSIRDALRIMQEEAISSIVVVNEKREPIGIFTERDVVKLVAQGVSFAGPIADVMTANPFVIDRKMKIHEAYLLLEARGVRHLIVVDEKNRLVGVVSEGDFIRHAEKEALGAYRSVKELMSPSPLMIASTTTLQEAADKMVEYGVHCAIVTDKDNMPIGILHERDITNTCTKHINFNDPIDEQMVRPLQKVSKEWHLAEAVALMEQHGLHQVVVADEEDRIVGILDRHVVLKAIHGVYIDFLIHALKDQNARINTLYRQERKTWYEMLFLRNLVHRIPDLVWLKDCQRKYQICNDHFKQIVGRDEKEIIGARDEMLLPKETAEALKRIDQEVIKEERTVNRTIVFECSKEPYRRFYDIIASPMRDEKGRMVGVLGVAHDVSKAKELLAMLDDAQRAAQIGSWKLYFGSQKILWSKECYRIFGIDPSMPVDHGRTLACIHPDDREMVRQMWQKRLEAKEYEVEYRLKKEEGEAWVVERAKIHYSREGLPLYAIGTVRDITDQKRYQQKVRYLMHYDHLTGLPNRLMLQEMLDRILSLAMRRGDRCALLLIDLDNFKEINESFGHAIGDQLLKEVSKRMRQRIRRCDIIVRLCDEQISECEGHEIARMGGDEFALVLSAIRSIEDAVQVAEELIDLIRSPFFLQEKIKVYISASIGIAIGPDHAENAESLLQYADSALYRAKSDGRITYALYSPTMTQEAIEKVHSHKRLREAIKKGHLHLFYQPIVHLATQRIVAAEALLRWIDPEEGIIAPDRFIPLAEQTGLIIPIGEFVIQKAAEQLKTWLLRGYHLRVAVNVSANQIHYYDLATLFERVLHTLDLEGHFLEMEMTESTLMRREDRILKRLHAIRAMGIKIAIDDFGTGYSSYSYLRRFPIDILKIDKSFIDDIPYDKEKVAIVKAIVAMGKALGFELLAEGIETHEQMNFLSSVSCDFYQGYLKSKPLSAEAFEALLKEEKKR